MTRDQLISAAKSIPGVVDAHVEECAVPGVITITMVCNPLWTEEDLLDDIECLKSCCPVGLQVNVHLMARA